MSMNVGSSSGDDDVVSTINTTPLVDVMLVLLIIFLITIPAVTQQVLLSLPKETNIARVTKPENVEIAVNKDGDIFWNSSPVADTEALVKRLGTIAVHSYGERAEQKAVTAWTTNRLEWLRWLKGIAREKQGPLWVGEFGLLSGTNLDLRADFEQMLADLDTAKVDLAAFWVFDLDGQKNTWSVTPSNDRAFMLRMASEANRR